MTYLNRKSNLLLIMILLIAILGFMLMFIINEPIDEQSPSIRVIESIPDTVEIIQVDHHTSTLALDWNEQRRAAIAEAKRLESKQMNKYNDYEISLMAKVVHAEAGNQDDVGKRLVADVIMNRVDSPGFPNTIEEVVTQKNQFAIYKWYTEDDLNAVTDEIVDRTDKEILFFRKGCYHEIGKPAYQWGDHYFSMLEE